MTINEAIKHLTFMKNKHGDDVLLYFDCPSCLQSFTPSRLETLATHLAQDKKVSSTSMPENRNPTSADIELGQKRLDKFVRE